MEGLRNPNYIQSNHQPSFPCVHLSDPSSDDVVGLFYRVGGFFQHWRPPEATISPGLGGSC